MYGQTTYGIKLLHLCTLLSIEGMSHRQFQCLQVAKASAAVAGRSLVHVKAEVAGEKTKYSARLVRKSRTC
jgi:hypothetical protein